MKTTWIDLGDIVIDEGGVRVVGASLALETEAEVAKGAAEAAGVRAAEGGVARVSGVRPKDPPSREGRHHGAGRPSKNPLASAPPTVRGQPTADTQP